MSQVAFLSMTIHLRCRLDSNYRIKELMNFLNLKTTNVWDGAASVNVKKTLPEREEDSCVSATHIRNQFAVLQKFNTITLKFGDN